MQKNEVRYYWLRDKQNNPVACVASRSYESAYGDRIEFAFAAYNPIDNFKKELGRAIAAGRLEAHHPTFTVKKEGNIKLNILNYLSSHVTGLPSSVLEAARYQLSVYKPGPPVIDPPVIMEENAN